MAAPPTEQVTKTTKETRGGTELGVKSPEKVVERLNRILADEYVLYTKTRNYHWNVTGARFYALHKLFEEQYEEIDEFIDDVAERARTLGGVALGSLAEMTQIARLDETPVGEGVPDADTMVETLVADHDALVNAMREDAHHVLEDNDDEGTNALISDLIRSHEKMAWMLRSHVEGA